MDLITRLADEVCAAGSENLSVFGGRFEGGYWIQQDPRELARLVACLAAQGPFHSSLEIGTAAGGTTRFIREHVVVAQTAIVDNGLHPRWPAWRENQKAIP